MAVVAGGAAFVFNLHGCSRREAKPVVNMSAIRGAHVHVCVGVCATSSYTAISVSKLVAHVRVSLVVGHRGVGKLLERFAGVVRSGASGFATHLELPAALRNQDEPRRCLCRLVA